MSMFEPGLVAGPLRTGFSGQFERQSSIGFAKPDASENIRDQANATPALALLFPFCWPITIHAFEKLAPFVGTQQGCNFPAALNGLLGVPLRNDACMDLQDPLIAMPPRQGLTSEPLDQPDTVRRFQDSIEFAVSAGTVRVVVVGRKQVQIMVAQRDLN